MAQTNSKSKSDAKDSKSQKDEKDCGCYAATHHIRICPPLRNVTHPLRYYEFTREEIKALEECDKESFYRRCIPYSTALATLTYTAIRFGWLRRNPVFGATPKVALAAVIGHIVGRLSFMDKYDTHLRAKLPPDSHLGKTLRRYYDEKHPPPKK